MRTINETEKISNIIMDKLKVGKLNTSEKCLSESGENTVDNKKNLLWR